MSENKATHDQLVSSLEDVLNVQLNDGNWNQDPYMHGMTNGLILAYGLILDVDMSKEFKSSPIVWKSTRYRVTKNISNIIRVSQVYGVMLIQGIIQELTKLDIKYE